MQGLECQALLSIQEVGGGLHFIRLFITSSLYRLWNYIYMTIIRVRYLFAKEKVTVPPTSINLMLS
ncbi:hypothetical protein WH47_01524 [Habropoda laboriosa]|uniref:Uncharacterized protein n=1 Tax=Habropoda laboriosa TaxID=597456 RepID=A0A0L7R0N8_9HYME|nr:hypothetical protein WH47_01524 [Habropoda laboriosa]